MIDELRTPEILRKLGEYRAAGKPWTAIQREIEKEIGRPVTAAAIKNAYEVYASRSSEIIAGDEELKGLLKNTVINQSEQLEEINGYIRDLMKKIVMENYKDPKSFIAAAREIREQINLQAKLLNHMQEGFNVNQINKIEYTKISVNNLEELEDSGYIKILRKPGQPYNPEVRDVVIISEQDLKELTEKKIVNKDNYTIQIEVKEDEKKQL